MQQTPIIFLNSIKGLFCAMETLYVFYRLKSNFICSSDERQSSKTHYYLINH